MGSATSSGGVRALMDATMGTHTACVTRESRAVAAQSAGALAFSIHQKAEASAGRPPPPLVRPGAASPGG
eukprot:4519453-Alexandrium_andersonii.AAC.1